MLGFCGPAAEPCEAGVEGAGVAELPRVAAATAFEGVAAEVTGPAWVIGLASLDGLAIAT